MFSDQLIDQLSQFIIRPHREIYGLDKLGPKKIIVKSAKLPCYVEVFRKDCTIMSEGKKLQLSIFEPSEKPGSNSSISSTSQQSQYLTKSAKVALDPYFHENNNQICIFLHTNSGSRLQGLQYSKYLLQHGHTVCLFDYSGSGVSQGEYVSMGINQSKDLANVIKFMQQKYSVQKVNLWGRSMGAVTAVLYAVKYPRNVRKMVLDSPFCSFRQLVKQIVNTKTGLPQFLFGAVFSKIQQNIKQRIHANLMDIDLKQQIIKPGVQKIPIFFLISKDDKLVQPIHVQTLYQLHKGYKKILYLQGSHNKPRPTEIREQCAEFFCNKINNVSSQKSIQGIKRQYLTLISRKYSEDGVSDKERKNKTVSSSLILNQTDLIPPTKNNLHGSQYNQNSFSTSFGLGQNLNSPLFLNLKKNRPQNNLTSAQTTPRQQNSVNKYSTSKISLSQLKKSQTSQNNNVYYHQPTNMGSCMNIGTNHHQRLVYSSNQTFSNNNSALNHYNISSTGGMGNMNNLNTNTSIKINLISYQNQLNHNNVNAHSMAMNGNTNTYADFKKQSRTMAIQYKNKIKQQINRM